MYTFLEVDYMWLICKSKQDNKFLMWHQDLSHYGQIVKTIIINLGSTEKDEGRCVLENDDGERAFVGARTVDNGDMINPGQDLVDTNEDDEVPIAEIADDEDIEFVIDDQNINTNIQANFYINELFGDDKDDI